MKIAVCCIAKLENRYIREFVAYYESIGVDKIFIYDNNDIEGEFFDSVIYDYIEAGFVEVINYRGRKQCQQQAYNECYQNNSTHYDWILFVDCDEYLTLSNYNSIKQYLSESVFDDYQLIHVNWLVYGDNGQIHYAPQPIQERFKDYRKPIYFNRHHIYPENFLIKTIVRGGYGEHINWISPTPHTPITDLKCCNSSGKKCNANESYTWYTYEKAYLKHYVTKSLEEWVDIKQKRGYPDQTEELSILNTDLLQFFLINDFTEEKNKYLKDRNIYYERQFEDRITEKKCNIKEVVKQLMGCIYTTLSKVEYIFNKNKFKNVM